MSDLHNNADAAFLLEDFCAWLGHEYAACPIGSDLLQEAMRVFIDERNSPTQKNRRQDFVSRLMVCGFAHLLTEPGRIGSNGFIARGFISIFVRAFGSVGEAVLDAGCQTSCRDLLERAEREGVPDADVWKFLISRPDLREGFLAILDRIVSRTCTSREGMGEVYRAIVEATPYGVTGLYDRDDVYLIFAAWLEFMVRAGSTGLCQPDTYRESLETLDPDVRAIYRDVASFYLEDVDACLQSPIPG